MKFEVWVGVSACEDRDTFEIPDEELDGLSEDEKEDMIQNDAEQLLFNMIDWGWREIKEES